LFCCQLDVDLNKSSTYYCKTCIFRVSFIWHCWWRLAAGE